MFEGFGDQLSKIILAALLIIFFFNLLSSPNTQGIIGASSTGSVGVIKALEGK